jgi:hypothetical protein
MAIYLDRGSTEFYEDSTWLLPNAQGLIKPKKADFGNDYKNIYLKRNLIISKEPITKIICYNPLGNISWEKEIYAFTFQIPLNISQNVYLIKVITKREVILKKYINYF